MKYLKNLFVLMAFATVFTSCSRSGYGCDYTDVKQMNDKCSEITFVTTIEKNDLGD